MREPDLIADLRSDGSASCSGRSAAPMCAANDPLPCPTAHAFQFSGSGGEYFTIWIISVLLTLGTLGLYSPWASVRRHQYFASNTTLAGAMFDFDGDASEMLRTRILLALCLALCALAARAAPPTAMALAIVLSITLPLLLLQRLRFLSAHTRYRGLRLRLHWTGRSALHACCGQWAMSPQSYPGVRICSRLPPAPYLRLLAWDALLTVCSAGLYRPFAAVRAYRFRLAYLSVITSGSFEHAAARLDLPLAVAVAP